MHSVKYYLPHLVFFGVFCLAVAPVLYYYQRRNPNPRFRPGLGEMTMISILVLGIGGAGSFVLGKFFRGDQDLRMLQDSPNEGAGWSSGSSAPAREDKEDSRYRKSD